jgi:hypothetical protein
MAMIMGGAWQPSNFDSGACVDTSLPAQNGAEASEAAPASASVPSERNDVDPQADRDEAQGGSSNDEGHSLQKGIAGWATRDVKLDSWKAGRNAHDDQNRTVYEALIHQGFSARELYTKGSNGKTLLQETLDANHIKDPRKIKDGTHLTIPSRLQGKTHEPAEPQGSPGVGSADKPADPGGDEQGATPAPKGEPTAAPVPEHKPAAEPTAAPVPEHKPAGEPNAAPPPEHKPAAEPTAAPVPEHKPAGEPTAPAEQKPAAPAKQPEPPPHEPTRAEKLADSLGISPDLLAHENARTMNALERLSPDTRGMYKHLSLANKRVMVDNLHKSTNVLFTSINHRDAFIKGSVMGIDVFDRLQGIVQDNRKDGKINAGTAAQLTRAIDVFRGMTPTTREAVVQLLEADVASRRHHR